MITQSGYKGVFLDKRNGIYSVYVAHQYVGRSRSIEEAAIMYDEAAKKHYGEFALTNEDINYVFP